MIKNLSDLRETLSLFSGEQEALRIAFVSELFSRTQTDLFEVDLKSFYELVEQFPSCQSVLISVFKKEIVRNLHLAAGFFLNALKYGAKLPENFRIHLRFFLQNALPVLLSNKHLQSICGDYFEYMDKQVRERLDQTEQLIDERRCTVISGVFEKLKIIHDFLKREINAAYAGSSSKMCAIQLNDYFGTYFFGDLVKLESVGFNSAHEDPFLPKETGLVSVNAQLPVTRSQTPSVSQRGRSPSSTHFFTQRVIRGVPQRITSAEYTRRR